MLFGNIIEVCSEWKLIGRSESSLIFASRAVASNTTMRCNGKCAVIARHRSQGYLSRIALHVGWLDIDNIYRWKLSRRDTLILEFLRTSKERMQNSLCKRRHTLRNNMIMCLHTKNAQYCIMKTA